tara:strand:+ start:404 stop:766 length:363 start_codon:yes stop_codon:yes gene_type:complete
MNDKKYISIDDVSKLLKINKHVIRYWDSKFDGISTRLSNNKQRFFNQENIKKISNLQKILYQNGKQNYSLDLADKIVSKYSKKEVPANYTNKHEKKKQLSNENIENLKLISSNLKKILNL